MRGAIAAGHPLTAETDARVLAGGGDAVDALLAAALVRRGPAHRPGGRRRILQLLDAAGGADLVELARAIGLAAAGDPAAAVTGWS